MGGGGGGGRGRYIGYSSSSILTFEFVILIMSAHNNNM